MIDPQCPQIKSSPPSPDIPLSVRRIERFSVVTGPTGIMGIVAIFFPRIRQLSIYGLLENRARSTDPVSCHIFASGDCGSKMGRMRWPLKRGPLVQGACLQNSPYRQLTNRYTIRRVARATRDRDSKLLAGVR